MKIGNSIKVKDDIKSPDYDNLLIEGWIGRIIDITTIMANYKILHNLEHFSFRIKKLPTYNSK